MRQIGRLVGDFSKAGVAITRLDEILSQKDEYARRTEPLPRKFPGTSEFDHVGFDSGPVTHQLEDIDFHIHPGETIANIGKRVRENRR
jgi:ABC-type bacteriocin/lantibiotic exporter with double-glycine peptidase domain